MEDSNNANSEDESSAQLKDCVFETNVFIKEEVTADDDEGEIEDVQSYRDCIIPLQRIPIQQFQVPGLCNFRNPCLNCQMCRSIISRFTGNFSLADSTPSDSALDDSQFPLPWEDKTKLNLTVTSMPYQDGSHKIECPKCLQKFSDLRSHIPCCPGLPSNKRQMPSLVGQEDIVEISDDDGEYTENSTTTHGSKDANREVVIPPPEEILLEPIFGDISGEESTKSLITAPECENERKFANSSEIVTVETIYDDVSVDESTESSITTHGSKDANGEVVISPLKEILQETIYNDVSGDGCAESPITAPECGDKRKLANLTDSVTVETIYDDISDDEFPDNSTTREYKHFKPEIVVPPGFVDLDCLKNKNLLKIEEETELLSNPLKIDSVFSLPVLLSKIIEDSMTVAVEKDKSNSRSVDNLKHPSKSSVVRLRGSSCFFCPLTFPTKFHLKAHKMYYCSYKRFQCKVCSMRFPTKMQLISHEFSDKTCRAKKHECERCRNRFGLRKVLENHLKGNVCGYPKTRDENCRDHLGLAKRLEDHSKGNISGDPKTRVISHETAPPDPLPPSYGYNYGTSMESLGLDGEIVSCPYCYRTCVDQNTLEWHRIYMCPFKRHMCPKCGRRFFSRSQLLNHLFINCEIDEDGMRQGGKTAEISSPPNFASCSQQTDTVYTCTMCRQKCWTLPEFILHLDMFCAKLPYQCRSCNQRFLTTASLQSHEDVHMQKIAYNTRDHHGSGLSYSFIHPEPYYNQR